MLLRSFWATINPGKLRVYGREGVLQLYMIVLWRVHLQLQSSVYKFKETCATMTWDSQDKLYFHNHNNDSNNRQYQPQQTKPNGGNSQL